MTNTSTLIVDYQNPRTISEKSSSPLRVLFWVILTGFTAFLVISILMPPMCASRPHANRVKCASNLRQIGQAIALYVAEHKTLPDDALKLITTCDLSTEVFVCPSTNDTASSSANPTLKNHCSYIFLFENKPLDFQNDAGRVTAYEVCKHHEDAGGNVLFADGHVDWFTKTEMEQMIKQLEAGINPTGANESTRRR